MYETFDVFLAIVVCIGTGCSGSSSEYHTENLQIFVYDADMGIDHPISGVSLTLTRLEDGVVFSRVTNPVGRYIFRELRPGRYSIRLGREDYETRNESITVILNRPELNSHSFSLNRIPASINLEPTIPNAILNFGESSNTEQFRFVNPHAVAIDWRIFHSVSWISSISAESGTLAAASNTATTGTVTIIIDRSRLPLIGWNEDNISVGTSEHGGAMATIRAYRRGEAPGRAGITAESNVNVCPRAYVVLTATASGATSFRWYRGNTRISGTTNTHQVTQSGTYHSVGVNSHGDGVKSDGITITINACPTPPTQATITVLPFNGVNTCPDEFVRLTASSTGATSFRWYRGSEILSETSNTLFATQSGAYFARGINASGEGQQSAPRNITINSCIPNTPQNLQASFAGTNNSEIRVSWGSVTNATTYRVRIIDSNNPSLYHTVSTASTSFTFRENQLFCGINRFEVIAINSIGQESSSAGITSLNRVVSLSRNPDIGVIAATFVNLSWLTVNPVHSTARVTYRVYRRVGNGTEVFLTETNNTFFTDTTVPCAGWGTSLSVRYRVRAFINVCGEIYREATTTETIFCW